MQDEIAKAYSKLRTRYTEQVFNKMLSELSKKELAEVQETYPFIVSEIMIKRDSNRILFW